MNLVNAQYYRLGENPSSVRWSQIKTDHFQVIYPEGQDSLGQRVTNLLEAAYGYAGESLGHQPRKVSVILQNHTADLNGFVTWAPKRMELYTVPTHKTDRSDYLSNLAVHEYRHVVQIEKLNQGLTEVLYFLLGEQGVGFVLGLTTPLWFLEGDAVGTETAFTSGGRGEVAEFEMKLRTQWLSVGEFSYEKASFGSFKQIVPDEYELGYFLTTYGKLQHGVDLWGRVFARIAKMPFTPFRFSSALKKETGMSSKEFYRAAFEFYVNRWAEILPEEGLAVDDELVLAPEIVPTNYLSPQLIGGELVALKNGYSDINQLIRVDKLGKQKVLTKMGLMQESRFMSNGKQLVWSEVQADKRWGYRSFSNIVLYDYTTGKKRYFTRKRRTYSPAINKKGNEIVAVDVDDDGKARLTVFNTTRKKQAVLYTAPLGEQVLFPVFIQNDNIAFVRFGKSETYQLLVLDRKTKKLSLLKEQEAKLTHLNYADGQLVFRSAENGIDNIWSINLINKELKQLTNSFSGAFTPFVSGGDTYYAEYTLKGYQIKKKTLVDSIPPADYNKLRLAKNLREIEEGKDLTALAGDSVFEVNKYRKGTHLFNLHSWQPVAFDFQQEFNPSVGLQLLSQNKLSSTVTIIGAGYDPTEDRFNSYLDVKYAAWFPVFDLRVYRYEFFDRNLRVIRPNDTTVYQVDRVDLGAELKVRVPLKMNRNQYVYRLSPYVSVAYQERSYNLEGIRSSLQLPVRYHLSMSRQHLMAKRDIVPRWSQAIDVGYYHFPELDLNGESVYGAVYLNLPFGFRHQVLKLYGAAQKELLASVGYTSFIRWPRGFASYQVDHVYSSKAEWVTPILYPDFNFWFLTYVQRLRGSLFFDYGIATLLNNQQTEMYSGGVELVADLNLMRYSYLVSLGARYLKGLSEDFNRVEMVFNVGF